MEGEDTMGAERDTALESEGEGGGQMDRDRCSSSHRCMGLKAKGQFTVFGLTKYYPHGPGSFLPRNSQSIPTHILSY